MSASELDIEVHDAMLEHGMAQVGHYTPRGGGASTPVRVYLTREVQVLGEFGQVLTRRDELQILDPGVELAVGGEVAVERFDKSGADPYILQDRLDDDGSVSRWSVRRG